MLNGVSSHKALFGRVPSGNVSMNCPSMLPSAGDAFEVRFGAGAKAPANDLDRMHQIMSMMMGEFDHPLSWDQILEKLDFISSSLMTEVPERRAVSDIFQGRFALLTGGSRYADWDQIMDDVTTMQKLAKDGKGDEFAAYNHFFEDKNAIKDLMLELLHEENADDMTDAAFQEALTNRKTDAAEDLQNRPLFAAMLGLPPKATWAAIRGAAADLSSKREFEDLLHSDAESLREQGVELPDDASFGDMLDAALQNGLFNT